MSIKMRALLFIVVQFFLFAVIVLMLALLPAESNNAMKALGIGLMSLGVGVVILAFRAFRRVNNGGPNVSPEPRYSDTHVSTGVYRYVRHPIYSGVILAGLGAAVYHGSTGMYVLAAALLIFFTIKSRFEESLLVQAYPDYRAYMHRTGRFFPTLRRSAGG